jgi:hypothetical protein
MTIEIEAGASQRQFSMKPLVVHAFFAGQPGTAGYPQLMQIRRSIDRLEKKPFVFQRETPSLSLRLRLVRYARADSDVLRTSSNSVLSRSVSVSLPFECGMTKFAATA